VFVNSHLPAHDHATQARNSAYSTIHSRTNLGVHHKRKTSIIQHDFVFWFGDLNYRLNVADADTGAKVRALVAKESCSGAQSELTDFPACSEAVLEAFRRHDQLSAERKGRRVFNGFSEAPVTFPPTYKFQPNTDKYLRFDSSKKPKVPAWTDRILWRRPFTGARGGTPSGAGNGSDVRPVFYRSSWSGCNISDHKPVMGLYRCSVQDVNEGRKEEVLGAIAKDLDRQANVLKPKITLSPTSIDFGATRLGEVQTATITGRHYSHPLCAVLCRAVCFSLSVRVIPITTTTTTTTHTHTQ
jgi:hypothetical protein